MNQSKPAQTDAQRLKNLLRDLKAETGMTQARFAEKHRLPGGPSMLSQHVSGNRPINLDHVTAYVAAFRAEGLQVSVGQISPSLEKATTKANSLVSTERNKLVHNIAAGVGAAEPRAPYVADTSKSWPLPGVTLEMLSMLTDEQKNIVKGLILTFLTDRIEKTKQHQPAKKATAGRAT